MIEGLEGLLSESTIQPSLLVWEIRPSVFPCLELENIPRLDYLPSYLNTRTHCVSMEDLV